jgi:hypothetical protein
MPVVGPLGTIALLGVANCHIASETAVTLNGLTVDTKGTKNTKNTKFGGSRYGLAGTPACGRRQSERGPASPRLAESESHLLISLSPLLLFDLGEPPRSGSAAGR